MKRPFLRPLLLAALCFLVASASLAADAPQIKLPPSGDDDNAVKALDASPRHGEWVDISLPGEDSKLKTWVVYPERKDKAPVVIVIHEIFGMTDWVRSVTDQLAAEGFIALAPDLLSGMGKDGGGTESFGKDVGKAIHKLAPDEIAKRLDAVRAYGIALPSATKKTASIGFCWGGTNSFAYAAHQPAINAAVVYYGTPPDKDALAKINAPIIAFYGGDDNRVTSTVDPAQKALADLKKDFSPHIYDGAGHGFLRMQSGRDGANLKAAQQAWPATIEFLKKNLE